MKRTNKIWDPKRGWINGRTGERLETKKKKERMEKNYLVWNPLSQKWETPYEARGQSPGSRHRPSGDGKRRRLEGKARYAQVNRIAARDGLRCRWCDVDLTIYGEDPRTKATIDHYPISRAAGGGNGDENAVLACKPCNEDRAKGKKGKARIESRRMFVAWEREQSA